MKYNGSALSIVVVGENDLPVGLYDASGATRVTTDPGSGVYAPNGSIRLNNSGGPGVYNPDGNIRGQGTNLNDGIYRPDGGLFIAVESNP